MKIDRRLNLVIPIEREEGPLYVHALPLALPVFQRHALVIGKAFAMIFVQGLSYVAGPRVAAMILKEVAEELGRWEGPEGVELGLIGELRRTAFLLCPTERGWQQVVLDDAVRRGLLDPEELSEVENVLVFFMVASSMLRGSEKADVFAGMTRIWEVQLSASTCSEFLSSLPTSTPVEPTGERENRLSIAS